MNHIKILCISLCVIFVFFEKSLAFGSSWQDRFTREDLKDNAKADYIFVCSDFASFDSVRIKRFMSVAFPETPLPNIYDGYRETHSESDSHNILVFFSSKHPSKASMQCLHDFSFVKEHLDKTVLEGTNVLGKTLMLALLPITY